MNDREQDALIALSLVPGLGPTLTRRCMEAIGPPQALLTATVSDLADVRGIGRKKAPQIRCELDKRLGGQDIDEEKRLIEACGAKLLASTDAAFPRSLRHIPDVPPLLYVRGELREEDTLALAVVGSRRCTHYGRQEADRLAFMSAQAGLCIVSGGAMGIDVAAHRAALRSGGRTVAVLGSGLARPYPREHAGLFDQISDGQGAVVSELPMTTPPIAENFPRRNRIISGLALGVLVVEAAQRSGALLTARLAAEEQGREVMAVPGRVDSKTSVGCHKMIREGWATLVTNMADILDALGETGQLLRAGVSADGGSCDEPADRLLEKLTDSQRRVVESLAEPRRIDEISVATGLATATIQSDLTLLEIRGVIEKSGMGFNRRQ